ncbi:hypothetical protein C8246_22220 [Paracidovorax avenae]|uniref:DNA/RNA helicase domain-containing protein n=1 Tax=Paracidovorax avenae TaxID=80867 RepID=UPI000D226BA5|nr:DNA/RNA helicase domain-containing protein [Paracidovorax avenae]AVS78567.1 hypothetical protein C8234_11115 [Paracidovorax avenae]AVS94000.1 hypothetical protein C8246_22220 [Paracidovorax avenae]AVS99843.1 hypothetical protein C8236_14160 [Paracidovorax avenae]
MYKPVNIQSILQASDSLNATVFQSYLDYYGVEIKSAEIGDAKILVNCLRDNGCVVADMDDFYVGYKIPQIGKEFDFLRFGKNFVLNIELKSNSTEEKILKQLLRNKYYLSFLAQPVHCFTFVAQTSEVYFLAEGDRLGKVSINELCKLVTEQVVNNSKHPDELFDPSDYLISPFNKTEPFLAGEYFLTSQQEGFRDSIAELLVGTIGGKFVAVTGSAGTGKTLLAYDIVRNFMSAGKEVLIIHGGMLNGGHEKLIAKGWNVAPIKGNKNHNFAKFDLILVDEAQRLTKEQLTDFVERVKSANCGCIFSYDKVQTLSSGEERRNVAALIAAIDNISIFQLSEKIRSNKEIAAFIKNIFSNKRINKIDQSNNIKITYFGSKEDARTYLAQLPHEDWVVLKFTPSQYSQEHHKEYFSRGATSHEVIGQEFDSVAVVIDKYFCYGEDGRLLYTGGAYYAPVKMLFQNVTRARKRLNVIIISNELMLKRCLAVLN